MAESLDSYSDIEDEDATTEQFNRAANHVKSLVSNLDSNKLLELYKYYKQGVEGRCNIPRPRWYEMQAKAKWDAWNSLGDLPQSEAKQLYIKLVSELDPDFEQNDKSNSWVAVSSHIKNDEEIDESDKTIFDYVKENNLTKLTSNLNSNNINDKDEDGMGLIHWAADRGSLEILKYLIESKIDVDMVDQDGQTALHYAVSCDHVDCVKLLVNHGADKNIKDSDDLLPRDLTTDTKILELL